MSTKFKIHAVMMTFTAAFTATAIVRPDIFVVLFFLALFGVVCVGLYSIIFDAINDHFEKKTRNEEYKKWQADMDARHAELYERLRKRDEQTVNPEDLVKTDA